MEIDQTRPMPPGRAPDGPSPLFRYDGRVGEIYPIFLVNLLLDIITLGIFRFWAITRMRRYLWSRLSYRNERLNYTGKGSELFLGFLLAGVILTAMGTAAGGFAELFGRADKRLAVIPLLLFFSAIIVLQLGAVFSAQRYRLSRTEWCGIRGGMHGSMLVYGLRSLLFWLVVPLTLFQLTPWVQLRLAERRVNASSFGDLPFSAEFSARRVYGRFLLTWLGIVLLAIVVFGVVAVAAAPMILATLRYGWAMHGHPADGPARNMIVQLVAVVVVAYLVFALCATVIGAMYQAAVLRHMADNSTLGPVQLSGRFSGGGLLGLIIGNLLITVITLGLGYPFVLNRYARYVCNNLWAIGSLDPEDLGQSDQRAPRFGEGMFQQLDAGGGIF
jgi:uncharacterized membrane protein YjgN (DUF898 family)